MPIYEYYCPKCRLNFEKMLAVSARGSMVNCPKCGSDRVKKLVSCFCSPGGENLTGASGCSSCSSGNCGSCH